MQSRYAAYATRNIGHIIRTTHPYGPHYQSNHDSWREQIATFCDHYAFLGLTIHGSETDTSHGWVEFTAHLSHDNKDASFTERSRFYLQNGRWLYYSAIT